MSDELKAPAALGRCVHKTPGPDNPIVAIRFITPVWRYAGRGLGGPLHHITVVGAGWPSICSRSVATAWSSPALRRLI